LFTGKETAGKITLKHVYEIATIKHSDPPLKHLPLKEVCELVIYCAKSCGIEVSVLSIITIMYSGIKSSFGKIV